MADRYDVIIIGSGAGGGTLAHKLAPSGKRILILERGPFLPREKENWDTIAVVQHERYHTRELWYDKHGNAIHPGTGYWVGGNTKVYGAALFRLRERDFEEVLCAGRALVRSARRTRYRSHRTAGERAVPVERGPARTAHPRDRRRASREGIPSVSDPTRRAVARGSPDKLVHPLQHLRRIPVSGRCKE